MSLEELGRNPVCFPVSDGTRITVSEYAAHFLREECGVKQVKSVKAAGRRYLYMPNKMPQNMGVFAVYTGRVGKHVTWPLSNFLALHVYHLNRYLTGDGRIHHDGSDSFLPTNFTRDLFERSADVFEEKRDRPKTLVPKVSSEVIQQQLGWLDDEIQRSARKKAAKKLNSEIGADVVGDLFVELVHNITQGQCEKKSQKDFRDWILGAVTFRCREVAKQGCANGDVIPDRLEVQLKKEGIVRGNMPDRSDNL